MSTIAVSDSVKLAYDDSGPPASNGQPYLTIFLVHGTIFYNKIYSKALALAPQYNLRLVAINMRDYPGSTPNTEEELADLGSDDPQRQAKYIKSAALEIATFAAKAVVALKLPALDKNTGKGGIAILGWSSGSLYTTALLAHAESLPAEEKDILARHLRTVILFDPAWFPTGHVFPPAVLSAPPGSPLYSPMRDMTITDGERIAKFFAWFSGYFEPPITEMFPLASEEDIQKAIAIHTARSPVGTPTLQRMTQADKGKVADFSDRVKRSNQMIRFTSKSVYKDNYVGAFTVADDPSAVWPDVDVLVAWGQLSVFETSWVASTIQDWLKN
ncbi:hypothetical protein EIP91_006637, partial [Steccherinum ochraceum]